VTALPLSIPAAAVGAALPPLWAVRRAAPPDPALELPLLVADQLRAAGLAQRLRPGMQVALTAGSRGIARFVEVLRAAAAAVRAYGAEPFLVPAMGSHGGAQADQQVALLAALGITAESVGCPLRATMETVELTRLADGTAVFLDRAAAAADGIIVINRIKAHTSFVAPIESGLAKMCAVGLGKQRGAEQIHRLGVPGLTTLLVPIAREIVARAPVLAGLALLEDRAEQLADVVGLPPAAIGGDAEAQLLTRAKALAGGLGVDQLDVLVVDQIGKNFSGTGMDTHVIGRMPYPGMPAPARPLIHVIAALELSPASHGNANGIGLADLTTAALVSAVDFAAMYTNALTSGLIGLPKAALPIILPDQAAAVRTAVAVCAPADPAAVRLMRIANTLQLGSFAVSPALLPEFAAQPDCTVLGPLAWQFSDGSRGDF
jgi:hypothetical protein